MPQLCSIMGPFEYLIRQTINIFMFWKHEGYQLAFKFGRWLGSCAIIDALANSKAVAEKDKTHFGPLEQCAILTDLLSPLHCVSHPLPNTITGYSKACQYKIESMSILADVRRHVLYCPWWRHQMEIFSSLLTICAEKTTVTGEFPAQRPVTRSFDVFFGQPMNTWLGKQWWGWWFKTPPRPLWRHCNA